MERTKDEIIQDARDALDLARRGLEEFLGANGRQRASGLRNVVVWGRITTATLQNLKTPLGEEFAKWWQPYSEELKSDSEFHYLYDLRNDVEKTGSYGRLSTTLYVNHLNTADLAPLMMNRPPNATGFGMGDRWGGHGWIIPLPDGTTETFYVSLPADIAVTTSLHFTEMTTSLRLPAPERAIEDVLTRYVDYLESLLGSAIQAFGNPST
jgi:hypothetical protein